MLVKTLPANEACVDLRTTDAGDLASAPWREASPSSPPSHAPSTLTASPPTDEPTGSTNAFGMDWRAAGWVSYLRDGKAGGGGHARSTAMPRAPHSAHHAVRRLWCFFAMSALSTKRRWGAQYVGWGEGGLAPVAHLVAMSGCVPRRPPQHGKSCLRTWRTARRSVWRTHAHAHTREREHWHESKVCRADWRRSGWGGSSLHLRTAAKRGLPPGRLFWCRNVRRTHTVNPEARTRVEHQWSADGTAAAHVDRVGTGWMCVCACARHARALFGRREAFAKAPPGESRAR